MSRRPYANPYVAGVGLGLVLLAAFVLTGRGLGASGAFASSAAGLVVAVAPETAARSEYFSEYLAGGGPWNNWLLIEILGVIIGAAISAVVASRWSSRTESRSGLPSPTRLASAATGGFAMGVGAVIARGCTSGQALSGGALLSVGSWLFTAAAFASAYALAPFVRPLWRRV